MHRISHSTFLFTTCDLNTLQRSAGREFAKHCSKLRYKLPAYGANPSTNPCPGLVFLCVPALKSTYSLSYARAQAQALSYWLGATVVEGASFADLKNALAKPTDEDMLPQWLHVCGDGARTIRSLLPHRSGLSNMQEVRVFESVYDWIEMHATIYYCCDCIRYFYFSAMRRLKFFAARNCPSIPRIVTYFIHYPWTHSLTCPPL